ncbi:hypothetical protein [Neisseria bacilliformis]|uniref:hypothetical protein n=1 Tax=Neisseria bacilliformis TaxID=267212 RepID=UPI0009E25A13|nr:hypothetical protein [Neisseria bacilliformis]
MAAPHTLPQQQRPSENSKPAFQTAYFPSNPCQTYRSGVDRAFMPDKPADLKNVGHKCPTYRLMPNLS